ncbi:MAG TPA: cell division protein [Legionella sp.]|nr:cell division protein [Legionella sp.]
MLGRLQKQWAYHVQASTHSIQFLLQKPMATLMTVVVIGMTLTLPTLFWVFTDNLQDLTHDWRRGGHVLLYLQSPLSKADETALLVQVQATPGVASVLFKSAAEGLAELQHQEGMQDIMHYLPENPLPAVMDVIPTDEMNTAEKVGELQQLLKSYPHVEQAKFDMQWVNRLYTVMDVSTQMARGLMVMLASAVILIIGNTLRMAMHHRHEEIQVLTLIGAGPAYIIRPFLYLGLFYGLAGAAVAMLLVNVILASLTALVNQLADAYDMHYTLMGLSLQQALLLLFAATALGWLAARWSVRSLCRASVALG